MRAAPRLAGIALIACVLATAFPASTGIARPVTERVGPSVRTETAGVPTESMMRQSSKVLVGPPSAQLTPPAPSASLEPSTVFYGTGSYLFYDSFESAVSPWATYGSGWGSTDFRHADLYYSAYCAQAFAPAPATYPTNYETWIVAGPLNMTECQTAILRYEMWLKTEIYHDFLWAAVSTDGNYWDGIGWSGDSQGWTLGTVDLIDYCGEPQVWLAFVFSSDSYTTGEGVYLDGVTITVNSAPRTTADSYATRKDTPKTVAAPGLLANDSDPNGDPVTLKSVTQPAHGSVIYSVNGGFTYTPTVGFEGVDTFSYVAGDPVLKAPPTGVTIRVGSSPNSAKDGPYRTPIDTVLEIDAARGLLANDTDDDGDALAAEIVTDPAHGDVVLNADGSFSYTPASGFQGMDGFTYRAFDGTLFSEASQVDLVVGNVAPSAADDLYRVSQNRATSVLAPGVLANDTDINNDVLSAALLTGPSAGSVTLYPDGSFIYTPGAGFDGADSFTYAAFDGAAWSPPASVQILLKSPSPVYRFYNFTNGTHFFTPSAEEADSVIANYPGVFRFEGVAYFTDPACNTQPLYRFYNRKSGSHFYTASADEAASILAQWPDVFQLDGQTYAVNPGPAPGSIPVYRFFNRTNGSHFYTASAGEADMVIANWSNVYLFEGPAFWVGQ